MVTRASDPIDQEETFQQEQPKQTTQEKVAQAEALTRARGGKPAPSKDGKPVATRLPTPGGEQPPTRPGVGKTGAAGPGRPKPSVEPSIPQVGGVPPKPASETGFKMVRGIRVDTNIIRVVPAKSEAEVADERRIVSQFKTDFPELIGTKADVSTLKDVQGRIVKPIPSSALPREKGKVADVPTDEQFIRHQLAEKDAARALTHGILGTVPILGTAALWRRLSPSERGLSVALDSLLLIGPALKGITTLARAAKPSILPLSATQRMAVEDAAKSAIKGLEITNRNVQTSLANLDPKLAIAAGDVGTAQIGYALAVAAGEPSLERAALNKLADAAKKYQDRLTSGQSPVSRFVDDPRLRTDAREIASDIITATRQSVRGTTATGIEAAEQSVRQANAGLRVARGQINTTAAAQDLGRRLVKLTEETAILLNRVEREVTKTETALQNATRDDGRFAVVRGLRNDFVILKTQRDELRGLGFLTLSETEQTLSIALKNLPPGSPLRTNLKGLLDAIARQRRIAGDRLTKIPEDITRGKPKGDGTTLVLPKEPLDFSPALVAAGFKKVSQGRRLGGGAGAASRGSAAITIAIAHAVVQFDKGTSQFVKPGGEPGITAKPGEEPKPGEGEQPGGKPSEEPIVIERPGGEPELEPQDLPGDKKERTEPPPKPKEEEELKPAEIDEPKPGPGDKEKPGEKEKPAPFEQPEPGKPKPTPTIVSTIPGKPPRPGVRIERRARRVTIDFEPIEGAPTPRGGQFPRIVQWQQGFEQKRLDLITGKVEDTRIRQNFERSPEATFRVVRFSADKPRPRRLRLGRVSLSVSGSGLRFEAERTTPERLRDNRFRGRM